MLKLYIANKHCSSWSLRPWVLMQTLGLAFEEVLVPFGSPAAQAFTRVASWPPIDHARSASPFYEKARRALR